MARKWKSPSIPLLGMMFLWSLGDLRADVPVQTPSFAQTVNIKENFTQEFGRAEVHYKRAKHPLDTNANGTENMLPLVRLRQITFVLRLENQLRTYHQELSAEKKALKEAFDFYHALLEHAHRVSNRHVRVCAYHMGLNYGSLSPVKITTAGPLPRTTEEYQRWATQPDPPPCFREQLFSEHDAERLTRLHQLQRLTRRSYWHHRSRSEKFMIEKEIRQLKSDIDGTMWIPKMKMSQIKVLPTEDLILPTGQFPQIKSMTEQPQAQTITPPGQDN